MRVAIAESMTYARSAIPDQSARKPLRVPRSQTAALMLIQQLARDHTRWTRGICQRDRLPALVKKFDQRFQVLDPARTRTRKRAQQSPTGTMVAYPQPVTDRWLWWLLLAGRSALLDRLADQHGEVLYPVQDRRTPITWAADYELRRGPRGSMAWWLTRSACNDIEAELRYLASAHGRAHRAHERSDDLQRAVTRARNRPMFSGVRQQVAHAIYKSQRAWTKTHRAGQEYPADASRLPWFRGSVRIYDDPPAVVVAE